MDDNVGEHQKQEPVADYVRILRRHVYWRCCSMVLLRSTILQLSRWGSSRITMTLGVVCIEGTFF